METDPLITGTSLPLWKKSWLTARVTCCSNKVNWLLPLVPLGIVAGSRGWSANWVFGLNFLAIVPLASILSFATEELSENVGETLSGLLNATLGNAIELIVSIIAISQNQIRVVQASMLGSILSNLLLVLGTCFVAGGYNRLQQTFNQTAAQTMSSLLALSMIGLLIPAAFHASLPPSVIPLGDDGLHPYPGTSDQKILFLSRGTSIILLGVYCLFLFFQLKTHKTLFESQEADIEQVNEEGREFHLDALHSICVLVLTTVLTSFCADHLVSSIDEIVESSGLSKTFIGLILIPIIGNAAEHVTAVVVAMKNKMDLAIGVAVGSSLQISLFVTPFMVLVGWAVDTPMSLYFSGVETAVMFVAVFITHYLILDGESNWLEGAMLLSTYMIIALAFFFYPDNAGN